MMEYVFTNLCATGATISIVFKSLPTPAVLGKGHCMQLNRSTLLRSHTPRSQDTKYRTAVL